MTEQMTEQITAWQGEIAGEASQEALGRKLARSIESGLVIYLEGDLGAGKTTLARGLLRGLGHQGKVKSPTYTLVEEYCLADGRHCFHFDLYRLADAEELEYLGMRDYDAEQAVLLVEWPQQGAGFLPEADIQVRIQHLGKARRVQIEAFSERGKNYLKQVPF